MSRVRPGSRPAVVLTVLAGSGAVILAAGRDWVTATVSGVPGLPTVSAAGQQATPGVTALALVAAAGAVALAVAGRVTRMVVAALLVLAGAGVLALVWSVVADPGAALHPALVRATGQSGTAAAGAPRLTGWPWGAATGAALVLIGGGLAAARGGSWRSGDRRYESRSAGTAAGSGERDRRLDAWDALSRGEDPTTG